MWNGKYDKSCLQQNFRMISLSNPVCNENVQWQVYQLIFATKMLNGKFTKFVYNKNMESSLPSQVYSQNVGLYVYHPPLQQKCGMIHL